MRRTGSETETPQNEKSGIDRNWTFAPFILLAKSQLLKMINSNGKFLDAFNNVRTAASVRMKVNEISLVTVIERSHFGPRT